MPKRLEPFSSQVRASQGYFPLVGVELGNKSSLTTDQRIRYCQDINKLFRQQQNMAVVVFGLPGQVPLLPDMLKNISVQIPVFSALECSRTQKASWKKTCDAMLDSNIALSIGKPSACRRALLNTAKSQPQISVIIPTCNRAGLLEQTLHSMVEQDFPKSDFEVLVVDNGSTDATAAIVKAFIKKHKSCQIRYLYEPVPGLVSGRHRGALEARAKVLVFCDDDIIASKGWLTAYNRMFVLPQINLVGGKNIARFQAPIPDWVDTLWSSVNGCKMCGYYSLLDAGDIIKEIDPYCVWGLNFGIRKSVLISAGGFNPDNIAKKHQRFQGDGETGLIVKLMQRGIKGYYQPNALVEHVIPQERLTIEYLENRQFYQGVCDSYTYIRNHGKPDPQKKSGTGSKDVAKLDRQQRMQLAYDAGYCFHQQEVKKDPKLLRWVLRYNYLDYKLP